MDKYSCNYVVIIIVLVQRVTWKTCLQDCVMNLKRTLHSDSKHSLEDMIYV